MPVEQCGVCRLDSSYVSVVSSRNASYQKAQLPRPEKVDNIVCQLGQLGVGYVTAGVYTDPYAVNLNMISSRTI